MVGNLKARSFLTLVSLVGVSVHMSPVLRVSAMSVLLARSPPCYCRARHRSYRDGTVVYICRQPRHGDTAPAVGVVLKLLLLLLLLLLYDTTPTV